MRKIGQERAGQGVTIGEDKNFSPPAVHGRIEGDFKVLECRNPICQKPFRLKKHNQVFCSPECKKKYYANARAMGIAAMEILRENNED